MIKPIFRIFDYQKTIEFYIDWLGFKIDWENRPENAPVYMQISMGDIVLHLSEHHGDGVPGARAIADFTDVKEYHAKLLAKKYKYNRPGIQTSEWNTIWFMVDDPFGNKLTFSEEIK